MVFKIARWFLSRVRHDANIKGILRQLMNDVMYSIHAKMKKA
jgi:hypothetical protein